MTVLENWAPGNCKLISVVTTVFATGTQHRDHCSTGITSDAPPQQVCGRSSLDLSVMDLKVVLG